MTHKGMFLQKKRGNIEASQGVGWGGGGGGGWWGGVGWGGGVGGGGDVLKSCR